MPKEFVFGTQAPTNVVRLVVYDGPEDYAMVRKAFRNKSRELNKIQKKGLTFMDGEEERTIPVTFYASHDLKMTLILLGLKGSSGKFFCPWYRHY